MSQLKSLEERIAYLTKGARPEYVEKIQKEMADKLAQMTKGMNPDDAEKIQKDMAARLEHVELVGDEEATHKLKTYEEETLRLEDFAHRFKNAATEVKNKMETRALRAKSVEDQVLQKFAQLGHSHHGPAIDTLVKRIVQVRQAITEEKVHPHCSVDKIRELRTELDFLLALFNRLV